MNLKKKKNHLDCIPDDVDYDQSVFVEQEFEIIIIHSQELWKFNFSFDKFLELQIYNSHETRPII